MTPEQYLDSVTHDAKIIGDLEERNAKLVAALTEVYELAAQCNDIRLDSPQMRRAREALQQSMEKP